MINGKLGSFYFILALLCFFLFLIDRWSAVRNGEVLVLRHQLTALRYARFGAILR